MTKKEAITILKLSGCVCFLLALCTMNQSTSYVTVSGYGAAFMSGAAFMLAIVINRK